jgi:signal transduction histidine kinase
LGLSFCPVFHHSNWGEAPKFKRYRSGKTPQIFNILFNMGDMEKLNILLVDDRPENLLALEGILESPDLNLLKAASGNEALGLMLEHDFALVILDVQMPEMNGFETAELMRGSDKTKHVPIIFVTAVSKDKAYVFRGYETGAVDYLFKPFVPEILRSKVKIFVDLHRQKKALESTTLELKQAITKLELSKEELKQTQQQQLQVKDQFISNVSHELRSPLTATYQFVTILLDGLAGDLSPEQREYLEIVLNNLCQLRDMINDLLEVTRSETGKLAINPQPSSLAEPITDTVATLSKTAMAKGIVLSADIPGDLPLAYADPVRVRQILINLISNGIKFTPERGSITVRVQISEQEPEFLCIAVVDTGYGISTEEREKVFDYLYQVENSIEVSRKGLGLGLYICKELVSRHGGRIWVEGQPGNGSTFYFTLPIFSLLGLLAPVLTAKKLQKGSLALIAVEVSPLDKRLLTKADERALMGGLNILKRCILPDKDVVLPRMGRTERGEVFFVVACADQEGTGVLVSRIEDQLTGCKDLQHAGLDWSASFTMVDIPSSMNNSPVEQSIKDIANSIEDMVKTALNQKKEAEK